MCAYLTFATLHQPVAARDKNTLPGRADRDSLLAGPFRRPRDRGRGRGFGRGVTPVRCVALVGRASGPRRRARAAGRHSASLMKFELIAKATMSPYSSSSRSRVTYSSSSRSRVTYSDLLKSLYISNLTGPVQLRSGRVLCFRLGAGNSRRGPRLGHTGTRFGRRRATRAARRVTRRTRWRTPSNAGRNFTGSSAPSVLCPTRTFFSGVFGGG